MRREFNVTTTGKLVSTQKVSYYVRASVIQGGFWRWGGGVTGQPVGKVVDSTLLSEQTCSRARELLDQITLL